jgi:hypothetical protein
MQSPGGWQAGECASRTGRPADYDFRTVRLRLAGTARTLASDL